MTEFVVLRPKICSYLMDDSSNAKKAKGTKKCIIKRILKFNDYNNCLLNNEIILKSQQRFKSEVNHVYTEEINKIALSSNDDKGLQTFDRIISLWRKYWKNMQNGAAKTFKYKMINLMTIIMKVKRNIIQSGHTFKIIHAEY